MRPLRSRHDPAPSRWSYRYQRLMLTPMFRKVLRIGIPLVAIVGLIVVYFADEARRGHLSGMVTELRETIEARPEFMVNLLAVEGASVSVEEEIREIFPIALPISSFDLELDDIRQMIADLPAVADASVRLRQGGVLVARITERQPVALWRSRDVLAVVDAAGVSISTLETRASRPELPIVAGVGANRHIPEALRIFAAAKPLSHRVRGLVRIGERRWDLVLDRDQRILLPEKAPVRAIERVIVLGDAQDMLERDLATVDMRLSSRPTIRMNKRAVEEWWRVKDISVEAE